MRLPLAKVMILGNTDGAKKAKRVKAATKTRAEKERYVREDIDEDKLHMEIAEAAT